MNKGNTAVEPVSTPVANWTPVAIPKPLYLTRSVIAPTESHAESMEQLRAAALAADVALRAAHESPEVTPITTPERQAAPSRYATMGVLDAVDLEATDLDEVLRRRRA